MRVDRLRVLLLGLKRPGILFAIYSFFYMDTERIELYS